MKDVLGYEFFTSRTARRSNSIRPMGRSTRSFITRRSRSWRGRLRNCSSLEATAWHGVRATSRASGKPTVYLAECSYDRKQARELIEGELKRLGYPVLPGQHLPGDEAEYVAAVESLLARCALSIHLVGESYGAVPDGPTEKSAGMLQNELAVARCRSGGLQAADLAAAGNPLRSSRRNRRSSRRCTRTRRPSSART